MDVLAVKQACKFAKEHAIANGPIVSKLCRVNSMHTYVAQLYRFATVELQWLRIHISCLFSHEESVLAT
jgi:TPP-dependent pyruvate/acetoin dehydrogenase alpha subunit